MPDTESSLLEFFEHRHKRIRSFLARHEQLHAVIDAGLVVAQGLASISTVFEPTSEAKLWCGVLWQRVADYQLRSIELILAGDLDAGMALLRMAAELARDVSILGKDEALFAVWNNREVNYEAYRKRFKFDQTPQGRAAQDLYKFASRFGIHGHRTTIANARSIGTDVDVGRVVFLEVDDDSLFPAVGIWLRSFFPVHVLCAEAVGVDNPKTYEMYELLVAFILALPPVLSMINDH